MNNQGKSWRSHATALAHLRRSVNMECTLDLFPSKLVWLPKFVAGFIKKLEVGIFLPGFKLYNRRIAEKATILNV